MRFLLAILLLTGSVYAQDKPTFAYVYQFPCPPCKLAKEVLEKLKKDDTLQSYAVKEYDFPFNREYLSILKVTRTPSFFILDKQGKLLDVLNDNREDNVRDFIKKHK